MSRPSRDSTSFRRSRAAVVLLVLCSLAWVLSQVLPDLLREQLPFATGRHVQLEGRVLDRGERRLTGRHAGLVDFYPRVRLPDGREVVLDQRVPPHLIPPVGQSMPVRCDAESLSRCRPPGWRAQWGTIAGIGLILMIFVAGGLRTIIVISRTPAV